MAWLGYSRRVVVRMVLYRYVPAEPANSRRALRQHRQSAQNPPKTPPITAVSDGIARRGRESARGGPATREELSYGRCASALCTRNWMHLDARCSNTAKEWFLGRSRSYVWSSSIGDVKSSSRGAGWTWVSQIGRRQQPGADGVGSDAPGVQKHQPG